MTLAIHPLLQEERLAMLAAALPIIAQYGWTMGALHQAARLHPELCQSVTTAPSLEEQARMSVALLFPHGIIQAAACWWEALEAQSHQTASAMDLESMRVRDRIACLVMHRLRRYAPYQAVMEALLRLHALPCHHKAGWSHLWQMADHIWLEAGDRSTDHNHYSKRLLLAGVISSSWIYWLRETGEDFPATEGFLRRRIQQVLAIPEQQRLWRARWAGVRHTVSHLPYIRFLLP